MDRSIYDYRSKGVYTVAGKKTVLDIKNLKLLSLPSERLVHKEQSCNNTNFQESKTFRKFYPWETETPQDICTCSTQNQQQTSRNAAPAPVKRGFKEWVQSFENAR